MAERGRVGVSGEFRLATIVPSSYTHFFHVIGCASVAQRQSTGFVNRMLWVQIPSLASRRGRPPELGAEDGTRVTGCLKPGLVSVAMQAWRIRRAGGRAANGIRL